MSTADQAVKVIWIIFNMVRFKFLGSFKTRYMKALSDYEASEMINSHLNKNCLLGKG